MNKTEVSLRNFKSTYFHQIEMYVKLIKLTSEKQIFKLLFICLFRLTFGTAKLILTGFHWQMDNNIRSS